MSVSGPVVVSLSELRKGLEFETLENAFDDNSLGIIVVKDLPREYHQLRTKVLLLASKLAQLPEEELAKLEDPELVWLVGWSLGKEKLNGKPDIYKGSYYINCSFYSNFDKEGPSAEEIAGYQNFKLYTNANKWPLEQLIPEFKDNCKKLINLIIGVSVDVAGNCDRYCESHLDNYTPSYLANVVRNSYTTKARLLHYYPRKTLDADSNWCGEHLDHSCLTGLTSALYIDENTGEILPDYKDPEAGLFIKNRKGETVKVDIPVDCLLFQTGSCLQEVSRNQFKLVPHFVSNGPLLNIARNTLAVFCQPNLETMVNEKESFADYSTRILAGNH